MTAMKPATAVEIQPTIGPMRRGEHEEAKLKPKIPVATDEEAKPSTRRLRQPGTSYACDQNSFATRNPLCRRNRRLHEATASEDLVLATATQAKELVGRLKRQDVGSKLVMTPSACASEQATHAKEPKSEA